jgi:uncharacterized protein YkwD
MSRHRFRLTSIFLGALLAATLGPTASPASAAELTVASAETYMISLINRDRARFGLRPMHVDSRLMVIAGRRSADMASRNYFSHVQPDGRDVFDMIQAARIRWYSAGEIIAWNNYPDLADSAQVANRGWLGSRPHRRIIMSTDYNYLGVGLALGANGRRYWTAVFLRGPDRTGAWVRPATPRIAAATVPGQAHQVTFSWTGGDVRLAALTAGLHSYQVQRRIDGGTWQLVRSGTTARTYALTVAHDRTVELRVRARDRAGNYGAWRLISAQT